MTAGEAIVAIAFLSSAWIFYKGLPAMLESYFAEKGKHLATHEDLQLLVDQLKQTTRVTEEIKTAISEDLWVRQEQWKLKRDIYLKAVTAIGELFNLDLRIHQAETWQRGGSPEERMDHLRTLSEEQKRVLADFRSARAAAAIILRPEATAAMDRYQLESGQRSHDAADFYPRGMEALKRVYGEMTRLARDELRIAGTGPVAPMTGTISVSDSTQEALPPKK